MPGLIHFKTRSKISKVLVKYSNNCRECCLFDIILSIRPDHSIPVSAYTGNQSV